MGVDKTLIDRQATWLFDIQSDHKPLPRLAMSITRIYRRILYKHLTLLETNRKPFNVDKVNNEIARSFISRLLAYQLYRRNYLKDKIYTNVPTHRSNREVGTFSVVGKLDYDTGALTINAKLRKLLKRAKVWVDFNQS